METDADAMRTFVHGTRDAVEMLDWVQMAMHKDGGGKDDAGRVD